MNLRAALLRYQDAITPDQAKAFARMGVAHWPDMPVGVVLASMDAKAERWQEDEGGKPHIVVGVEEDGVLVDLVAFEPRDPNIWASATGVGWALGVDAIRWAKGALPNEHDPLLLVATPLDWLRAQGNAACVIDGYSHQAAAEVRDVKAIVVPNAALARALRLQLTKPPALPEISIWEPRRHAA